MPKYLAVDFVSLVSWLEQYENINETRCDNFCHSNSQCENINETRCDNFRHSNSVKTSTRLDVIILFICEVARLGVNRRGSDKL